jgi:hypothetical protein
MQPITLQNPKVLTRISQLSQQMHIPETDVVEKAIDLYAETIKKKSKLMSFAGVLSPKDGEDILSSIKSSRVNKDLEIEL